MCVVCFVTNILHSPPTYLEPTKGPTYVLYTPSYTKTCLYVKKAQVELYGFYYQYIKLHSYMHTV